VRIEGLAFHLEGNGIGLKSIHPPPATINPDTLLQVEELQLQTFFYGFV